MPDAPAPEAGRLDGVPVCFDEHGPVTSIPKGGPGLVAPGPSPWFASRGWTSVLSDATVEWPRAGRASSPNGDRPPRFLSG